MAGFCRREGPRFWFGTWRGPGIEVASKEIKVLVEGKEGLGERLYRGLGGNFSI